MWYLIVSIPDLCTLTYFVHLVIYRGYSNVFVKYVHFTSEIKDIFNKKTFIIYKFLINFKGKEKRILLYISFCFDFLVVADELIKAFSFIKLLSDSDFLEIGNTNRCFP